MNELKLEKQNKIKTKTKQAHNKAQSTKHKAQNTKHKTQNTKHSAIKQESEWGGRLVYLQISRGATPTGSARGMTRVKQQN